MQIPGNSFLAGLGFLNQPQAGSNQQINPELQAKANAKAPVLGRDPTHKAPTAAPQVSRAAPQALAASLSRAENLAQAVQVLSDQGRLPPRGSLIDLSA